MCQSIAQLSPQCAAQSINAAVTTILQVVLASYCNITSQARWQADYGPTYVDNGPEVFDFIVIGGGTAGSVVAGRLSDIPHYRVLLIEAGSNPPIESEIPGMQLLTLNTDRNWNYVTESNNISCLGYPTRSCPWTAGKMLGGSSGVNLMVYFLGNKRDFDNWERMGNPTWEWNDAVHFSKKTENYIAADPHNSHGTNGPLVVDHFPQLPLVKDMIFKAAQEGGHKFIDDFREGNNIGYGLLNALVINGTRNTPAKAFLQNTKPNLKIIKNAIVTKINFDNSKRARSVNFVYRDAKNKSHELEAKNSKEIIMSAGSTETPKLLMLSGIGPQHRLKSFNIPVVKNSPGVGQNVQDHVALFLLFKCDPIENEDPLSDIFNYLTQRQGTFAGIRLADLNSFLDIGNVSGVYPNIQVIHHWFAKGTNRTAFLPNAALGDSMRSIIGTHAVLGMYIGLLNPKSRGKIELASSDYRQQPSIFPNYLSHDDDIKLLIRSIRTILKLQDTPTFKRYGVEHLYSDIPECRDLTYGTDQYWECFIRHTNYIINHPVGSSKMGPDSDSSAVVDHRLRVKGVKRLRVADASIMPTIVSGNTQAATVVIGEKAADFIKKDWMHSFHT